MLATSAAAIQQARHGIDDALLIVVEDAIAPGRPWAGLREEERRADALLLVVVSDACAPSITSLPRDLVLSPRADSVSVLYGALGPDALRSAVARTARVHVAGVTVLRFADVAGLVDLVGGVSVTIARPTIDGSTGFSAGAGLVRLNGEEAVRMLRGRAWQEWDGSAWTLPDGSDIDRMRRTRDVVDAARERFAALNLVGKIKVLRLLQGRTAARNPLALAGLAHRVGSAKDVDLGVVPTDEERQVGDLLSPFAWADAGALRRLRVVGDLHSVVHRCRSARP